jgi:uncharacterized Zn finger protein
VTCDSCHSTDVTVDIEPVKPHGPRAVFKCNNCGTAWINTEPTTAEQIIVGMLAAQGHKHGGSER